MGHVLVMGRTASLAEALGAESALKDHTIQHCFGVADAIHRLRRGPAQVLLTDPETPIAQDLALTGELASIRPGVRIIVLAPEATSGEVIAAIRAQVFACFTAPFELPAIVDMVRSGLSNAEWRDSIEVVSGLPHWLTLRVSCHMVTVDRLVAFMSELQSAVPADESDLLIAAFRELLLNAMEHAIVYHFRDPGNGFDPEDLGHAVTSPHPDDVVASALRRAEMGLRPGGFGMLIARQVADELVYNERHNEVLMIKHLD
jgi:DNA-binding response OmpR family regulator